MSLKQPFPSIASPFVDQSGNITPVWLNFLLNGWQRTNSGAGPVVPLTGINDTALTAAVAAASASAASAQTAATAAQATATDAQILAALGDTEAARSDDQAALLAQLIAD